MALLYRPIRISSHRVHHRCAYSHSTVYNRSTNPFVIVIGMDFSKAFDTLRHDTLLNKMAHLDIADPIYNWLVDYFSAHQHSTRFRGSMSQLLEITASIIQGSVIGPVSYVVSASDLLAITPGNSMFKSADDTYVVTHPCLQRLVPRC